MTEAALSLGAILLAAGGSSRLGQPKQLVAVNGKPLVARQAGLLLDLQPACIVVVTGAVEQQVVQALHGMPLEFTHNEDWPLGMGQSIACGIKAMPERVRGALLLLCDQWRLQTEDLRFLVEAWAENPRAAVAAKWSQGSGPPVIFPRSMFARLSGLSGDKGARQVLRREAGQVRFVPMERAAYDLDVPADLP